MSGHQANEWLRKTLHIFFGIFAFSLRWLTWWQAAIVAVVAIVNNYVLLHRIVGKRVARDERGYDVGILLYPCAVLALILVFRERLEIAGAAWAILAFGDGFATIAGKLIRGPRLPWNPDKSWSGLLAFVAFGAVGAHSAYLFLRPPHTFVHPAVIIVVSTLVAAFVESLPLEVDDNLTVPLAASLCILGLSIVQSAPDFETSRAAYGWMAANTVLAIVGYVARSVNVSGMIGGWILGTILIFCGGWPLYVALLVFFVIGTGGTKLGYRRKAAEGLAQEEGGRRGFRHAFANVGVAAILALLLATAESWNLLLFAAIASLATAAADTTGSEIGQLFGRRAFLPLSFKSVPRGTEGAVSLEGTVASLVASFVVTVVAVLCAFRSSIAYPSLRGITLGSVAGPILLIGFAGFVAAYVESIVGAWNRRRPRRVPNDALNFFNTLVGALLVVGYALTLH